MILKDYSLLATSRYARPHRSLVSGPPSYEAEGGHGCQEGIIFLFIINNLFSYCNDLICERFSGGEGRGL